MSSAVARVVAEHWPCSVLATSLGAVVSALLIRILKVGLPRASGDAVSNAHEVLSHTAHVFRRSSETSGSLSHPWVIGDVKVGHWVLDGQLVEVRDRVASKKFRKHVEEVRSSLQGVWTERAVGRAAFGAEGHVASASALRHQEESKAKAVRQARHAHNGSLAVKRALEQLARLSKRV